MPSRQILLVTLLLAASLAGCHTTRMGQSIDFPAPQRQAPAQ